VAIKGKEGSRAAGRLGGAKASGAGESNLRWAVLEQTPHNWELNPPRRVFLDRKGGCKVGAARSV